MPYRIQKRGKYFLIINKETGKIKGRSLTRKKAQASIRARLGGEHGWKPTKRR